MGADVRVSNRSENWKKGVGIRNAGGRLGRHYCKLVVRIKRSGDMEILEGSAAYRGTPAARVVRVEAGGAALKPPALVKGIINLLA